MERDEHNSNFQQKPPLGRMTSLAYAFCVHIYSTFNERENLKNTLSHIPPNEVTFPS